MLLGTLARHIKGFVTSDGEQSARITADGDPVLDERPGAEGRTPMTSRAKLCRRPLIRERASATQVLDFLNDPGASKPRHWENCPHVYLEDGAEPVRYSDTC